MKTRKELLTLECLTGLWAIIPTPARAGAESWRENETVDIEESARVVDGLIRAGVQGILSMGTLGECATLTETEKKVFMSAIVDAASGRVPVFVGTTTLSTRDTIELTRFAKDLGADGTMLGIPNWCPPAIGPTVQFYRDVAEACPEMAIVVYANTEIFRFEFPPPFWAQVSEIPQVIGAKYAGLGRLLLDLEASRRRIRLMPVDFDYYGAARIDPEFCSAFWTSGAVCGPNVVTTLRDAVERAKASGDWTFPARITAEIGATYTKLFPNGNFREFSTYNIALEKERMNAAGWMRAGPCRPPYHVIPEAYAEGARQSGRMWAELDEKYRPRS